MSKHRKPCFYDEIFLKVWFFIRPNTFNKKIVKIFSILVSN